MLFRFNLNKSLSILRNITLLQVGEQALITEYADNYIACKLMAMGLLPGSSISLVRKAPFGGAYYIKTDNHYVALRKDEAKYVMVSNG